MPAFVIMSSQFLHIRQQYLETKFTLLNESLNKCKSSQLHSVLQKYFALNKSLAILCSDIEQCSTYWTTPLTVYFIGYITLGSYFVFIVFFLPNLDFFVVIFFWYTLIIIEVFQFLLVHEISKISKCSDKIEKINSKFYLQLFKQKAFKYCNKTSLLKVI